MEIFFRTKEESNRTQEEEFLKLAPQDRFYSFLALMNKLKIFINSAENNIREGSLSNNNNNNNQSEFHPSKISKSLTGLKNNNFKIIIND